MEPGRGQDAARREGTVLWLDAPPPPDRAAAAELLRQLRDRAPDLALVVTCDGDRTPFTEAFPTAPPPHLLPPPGEAAAACTAFLETWRPALGVLFPSRLGSAVAQQALDRGIRLFLVARHLPREWRTPWRLGLDGGRRRLRHVAHASAETESLAAELRAIGLSSARLSVSGALAEGGPPPPCNETDRRALSALFAGRPVWLAAGTTAAEERVVVPAHEAAVRQAHRLLLILVPDDPARGPILAERLRDAGWDVALRSDDAEPEPDTQIYVADTEDEVGLWLRLAPICFLGGTLSGGAGTDPFHAAALGSVILHGPALGAHSRRYRRLDAAAAARPVADAAAMAEALSELLAPDRAALMACAAWELATEGSLGTERLVDRILQVLDLAKAE